ncbi:barstar family protein [Noviherbaspirillum massiliense]|uniref:barstar family protein n=1 Tax=Noviherbaspirillum massiliense TaxID=1465823 RepID=UPI0002F2C5B8|nr:barstar family protein [Noviherbaspirillum massiliense]
MPTAHLNGQSITDWDSFHTESKKAFGFPDFYGRNMDAWIDCLSYLRDDDGMASFRLAENEVLRIEVTDAESVRQRAPDILAELALCVDVINERYADYGEQPALELVLR